MKHNTPVVKGSALKALLAGGQGFDPCLQRFTFSFVLLCNQVQTNSGSPSYSLKSQSARWPQARSGGPDVMSTICPSQSATLESESQYRPIQLGLGNCNSHPLIRPKPPKLSLFFYYFLLFIYYFYYLTNQSKLFLDKIKKNQKYFLYLNLISVIYFC